MSRKPKASKTGAKDGGQRPAIVLHPYDKSGRGGGGRSPEGALAEAAGLTLAIGMTPVAEILIPMTAPRPSTYLGEGKVEEIAALCEEAEPEVVDEGPRAASGMVRLFIDAGRKDGIRPADVVGHERP